MGADAEEATTTGGGAKVVAASSTRAGVADAARAPFAVDEVDGSACAGAEVEGPALEEASAGTATGAATAGRSFDQSLATVSLIELTTFCAIATLATASFASRLLP